MSSNFQMSGRKLASYLAHLDRVMIAIVDGHRLNSLAEAVDDRVDGIDDGDSIAANGVLRYCIAFDFAHNLQRLRLRLASRGARFELPSPLAYAQRQVGVVRSPYAVRPATPLGIGA